MVKLTIDSVGSNSKKRSRKISDPDCSECGDTIVGKRGWFNMKARDWTCDRCMGTEWIGEIEDDLKSV